MKQYQLVINNHVVDDISPFCVLRYEDYSTALSQAKLRNSWSITRQILAIVKFKAWKPEYIEHRASANLYGKLAIGPIKHKWLDECGNREPVKIRS